jgi:transcription initiation factor TFIIIB Brf1 subunit/transcription initiation factor TFIIB
MRQIKDMASRLNLKDPTVNRAQEIYKQIEDRGIKGVSMLAKVATVIFIASRIEKQPKSIKDILKQDQVSHKELSSCYKKVKELIPELKN